MTSFIAAGGSGRSVSVIPAVPAASSVTTIAFMGIVSSLICRHQGSSGSNHACGPLLDVSADDVEHQVDAADVFQRVVLKVDELLRAEVERLLTVGSASGADDVRAELTCELRHHRPDCAGRAVHEDALPRLEAAMLEQSLPRR